METKTPLTHWKKMTNPKYVGSHDLLPGQELSIIFDKVVKEMVKNTDGKEEMCVVAYMKGAHKPLIMNKTNMKIVTKVLNTPYIEEWIGKSVTIYSAKVKAFGEVVDAIRVKAK